jgi:hypothetical protein
MHAIPHDGPARFFFIVHNGNHVRLFAPVVHTLRQMGQSVRVVHIQDFQKRPAGALEALRAIRLDALPVSLLSEALTERAVVVVGNDWSPRPFRELLVRARHAGAYLVGVVEGCRFGMPPRYRLVDQVLAWGPSASEEIGREVDIVGSPTIEHAAVDYSWFDQPPFAAINYKYAYAFEGVTSKDNWLPDVLDACRQLPIRAEISHHPGNPPAPHGAGYSDMDHLLRRTSVLISRSSTVVYEALARGKPVVLYPQVGEKLCEFAEPMGAYEIATNAAELAVMAQRALQRIPERTAVGAKFLARHVRIGPDGQATQRIVERLLAV